MTKQVTIAFRPGASVRVTDEDGAKVVRYDSAIVGYSSDEFTGAESPTNAAPPTKPPAPPSTVGQSELEQLIRGWTGKVDAQSRLVFKDGTTTEPEPTDPLPTDFGAGTIDDQVRVLLDWQAAHSWYGNQIVIDGNKLGQPGREPGIRFTTEGGKLRAEPGTVNPLVAPTVTLPTEPGKGAAVEIAWPAKEGQIRVRSGNLGAGTFELSFTVPDDVQIKPGNLGFMNFAETAGADVTARDLMVWVNGESRYNDFRNTAPTFNFTVGDDDSGPVNFEPGDKVVVICQASTGYTGQNSGLLCDFAVPERY